MSVADCLSRWAYPAGKAWMDTSSHGDTKETEEAKHIIEFEKAMEEGDTKNKRVAKMKKLSVVCPKTPNKVRAIGARRLVRVQKKKRRERHKTKTNKAQNTTRRTTGKQRYDGKVCYEPMHPTPSPLHVRRGRNQVHCERGHQRYNTSHKNKHRSNSTRHKACIHTRNTLISPFLHRRQAPARYMKTETRSRRNMEKKKGYRMATDHGETMVW